jgi:transposase
MSVMNELPFPELCKRFTDEVQNRYEASRSMILYQVSAVQRARETGLHPQTLRDYARRFRRDGMLGLFDERDLVNKGLTVADTIREQVRHLKTLYPPLHHREIANIVYARLGVRVDHKTVKNILKAHPVPVQPRLPFPKFRDFKDPYQARVEVVKLYYQGWNIKSISGFVGVSRKHIYTLLERFEEEAFVGLIERSHAPHHPPRKLSLPVLKKIADLQREYPYLGRFRIWGLLKKQGITDLGESTVGAAMAFNRFVYTELSREQPTKPPRKPPFKSRTWHQYWFVDHRYLVKINGIQYYGLAILEGYSRAFLAGMVVATQARGPFLKLLYETIALWGAPAGIVSDGGGAFISGDYKRVCRRLEIHPHQIEPKQSWQNLIETQFAIQQRMSDFKFAQADSEAALQALYMGVEKRTCDRLT